MRKIKLNDDQFWHIQYFYEWFGAINNHDQEIVYKELIQKFGEDKVKAYEIECRKRFKKGDII
ncbi:hypothetical protein [Dielma fastidiosa]|uniref:Uncharacterized protein n=1 Tax=Dielma fastidiosa TaxID=1034346 RepID=A0A318KCL7_9FIRM|nr:hypothetical protein [Dielma fastidiosa]PXX74630.1 hypothetical protein DES51_12216 [Dielma fastidiosa]